MLCTVHYSFKLHASVYPAGLSSKKVGRAGRFCRVCDGMSFSVLFEIYDVWDMIKLLELHYLILVL